MAGARVERPSEVGGGGTKGGAVARALVLDHDIVLYDEPTTGLDPMVAGTIEDLISETQRHLGKTFVVITRELKTALRISQKMALLEGGRIAIEGRPEEVLRSGHPLLEAFLKRERYGAPREEVKG